MKNYSMVLTEKQQKYQHDGQEYLTGKEILPSGPGQIIHQAKFTYYHLGKTFEKQKQRNSLTL